MLFVTWEKFTTLQFPLDQAPRRRNKRHGRQSIRQLPLLLWLLCVLMTNPGRPVKLFFSSSFLSWSTQNNNNNNSAVVQQSLKNQERLKTLLWIAIRNGRDWNSIVDWFIMCAWEMCRVLDRLRVLLLDNSSHNSKVLFLFLFPPFFLQLSIEKKEIRDGQNCRARAREVRRRRPRAY